MFLQRLASCDMEVINFEGYNHIVVTVLEEVISLSYIVMYLQKKTKRVKIHFKIITSWRNRTVLAVYSRFGRKWYQLCDSLYLACV